MKIVFIVTCLPVGGAEMALYRLLSHLRQDIEAHVISLQTVDEVGEMIHKLGVPVEGLEMIPNRPNPLAILRLAKRIRQIGPDLVQTWMYHSDLAGGIATKLAAWRCPVIWSVRHNNLTPGRTKRTTILVAKLCAVMSRFLPSAVVFNSESSRTLHSRFGYASSKCEVIPNGFDLQLYVPNDTARLSLRSELGLDADVPLVGMFARFNVIKNHAGFVEIIRLLHSARPECQFVLAGLDVDNQNAQLGKWLTDAKVAHVVHLLGPRRDMPRLMAGIDLLAMPSWKEAFPNVVAEAMACGVPCVVTAVGDAPVIAGNVGFVVPPGDAKAFASALGKLLSLVQSSRRELAIKARAHTEENYDIRVMARRFEALYAKHIAK